MENENKEQKVFTQEEVNAIIKDRLERERSRYNGDADALAALQQEVTKLREDLEKATVEVAEKEQAYRTEKINTGVLNTLTEFNIVAPAQISRMFIHDMGLSDDGVLTIKDQGQDVPFRDYIEEFARTNPWAVRNTQLPGSGGASMSHGVKVTEREDVRNVFVRKD